MSISYYRDIFFIILCLYIFIFIDFTIKLQFFFFYSFIILHFYYQTSKIVIVFSLKSFSIFKNTELLVEVPKILYKRYGPEKKNNNINYTKF